MSLEDLDSEFNSDESDYEAEKNASDGQKDDDDDNDECSYWDLYNLHLNLRCFQHIYLNNNIIDMENDASPSSDFESMLSELEFIHDHMDFLDDTQVQDFIQMYEEMASPGSSTSSSSPSSVSSSSSNSNLIIPSDVTDA